MDELKGRLTRNKTHTCIPKPKSGYAVLLDSPTVHSIYTRVYTEPKIKIPCVMGFPGSACRRHEVGPSGLPEPTTEDEAKVLLRCGAEAAVTGAAFQVLGPDITSEKIVNSPGVCVL